MRSHNTQLFLMVWIFTLYVTAIVLFTKGFLLKRLEIPQKSTCSDFQADGKFDQHGDFSQGCWTQRRFKQAVLLVIDALRFDFAVPDSKSDTAFQNRLPFLSRLLVEKPLHSRLYEFLADPPTTTMQRLKGLTTGSLPTFVDAGSNFASSEIVEDNFISQLTGLGGSITFMGDDTWESLFIGKFKKAFPYPSFNVKDLHTVDNGVIEHLIPEIINNDWHLLIAHFLGVDHCGHRFGPYHSAMSEKLSQMNDVIRSVVETISNETVLFIFGDHGMTSTGDHGGDSADELSAALFVYSPSQLMHPDTVLLNPLQKNYKTLSQVDLVPTLSLLLGTPIPFSNLGSVMTDLFTFEDKSPSSSYSVAVLKSIEALRLNSYQVKRYIDEYSRVSDEFPHQRATDLQSKLDAAERLLSEGNYEQLSHIQNLYIDYLNGVKHMCQRIWAKFDLVLITCGILMMVIAITSSVALVLCLNTTMAVPQISLTLNGHLKLIIKSGIFGLAFGIFAVLLHTPLRSNWATILFFLFALISSLTFLCKFFLLDKSCKFKQVSWESFMATVLMLFYAVAMTSNSYVVREDDVCVFLIHTLLLTVFLLNVKYTRTKRKSTRKWDLGVWLTQPLSRVMFIILIISAAVRLSAHFRVCREEQYPACESSAFAQSLSSLPPAQIVFKNMRYFLSLACVSVLPLGLRFWMSHYGNLNGSSAAVTYAIYGLPLAAVCASFYWALQALPDKTVDSLPVWQQVLLPRIVYSVFAVGIIIVLWKPLTVYVIHRGEKKRNSNSESASLEIHQDEEHEVVKKVFKKMKSNWKKPSNDFSSDSSVPMVYGLATVYSASYLLLVTIFILVLTILLGDGFAPAMLLLSVQMFFLLELYAVISHVKFRDSGSSKVDKFHDIPWSIVALWALMASQYFFATGHQATVPSIRFESAFVGFHGDFPFYLYFVAALMIGLNTYAGPVIFTVSLPLIIFWPYSRGTLSQQDGSNRANDKGEFLLHENEEKFSVICFRLFMMYTIFLAVRFLGTMVSAGIHRRHLMVWKIFAPRFVFEGVSFLLTMTIIFIIYLILLRLDKVLKNWFDQLVIKCHEQ
ncbi:GPI ethanolamine phosphate transferase 3, catalytic subunit-like [Saccoglossus kowalevskii]|uniref:GPI ethanolamine phosphate transferase 3-like n=1 Tax=Saccoglossus kowalevskii TaxID=10224 RepID=A0ABM0M2A0_SACKO|nr:PREDICTED: GPI ethanolamine phosphate transferase 3-like [Saccoglossus kowalevskii]